MSGSTLREQSEVARELWNRVEWPDWVPVNLREMIARDYAARGDGPAGWRTHSHQQHDLGDRVAIDSRGYVVGVDDPAAKTIGRFVFCWSNIARLVCVDGEVLFCSVS